MTVGDLALRLTAREFVSWKLFIIKEMKEDLLNPKHDDSFFAQLTYEIYTLREIFRAFAESFTSNKNRRRSDYLKKVPQDFLLFGKKAGKAARRKLRPVDLRSEEEKIADAAAASKATWGAILGYNPESGQVSRPLTSDPEIKREFRNEPPGLKSKSEPERKPILPTDQSSRTTDDQIRSARRQLFSPIQPPTKPPNG